MSNRMKSPQHEGCGGSKDEYQGLIPCIWKRIRQYRFRDTYQQMNGHYHPRRRRKALMKSTRLGGKRSWGLKITKLRLCMVPSPVGFVKKLKNVYFRMVMTLTGKKNSNRLANGNHNSSPTKTSSKRIEVTTHEDTSSSVIYFNYSLKEGSLSPASGYTKW